MKKYAVLIVRYESDIKVFKEKMEELANSFFVYVYDNSKDHICFDNKKIYYHHDGENGGLAKAINHCAKEAIKNNINIMAYFDQDSAIDRNLIFSLMHSYIKQKERFSKLYALGPQPVMQNGQDYPVKVSNALDNGIYEATEIITSGMTFCPKDLENIGFFDEDLFLDMVDFEICWRAIEKNMLVMIDRNIKMPHEVGVSTIKLPFKVVPISSPIRNYYQTRNVLYLSLYKHKKSKMIILYYLLRRLVNFSINMIFANQRTTRLKYNILGISDAASKRMGKYEQHH